MKKFGARTVAALGLLIALNVVLARFCSLNLWNLRIGLNFLPIALGALLYGPLAGGLVGAFGDLIGALLFPTGPYFPGFTVSALLTGLIYGWMLYRRREKILPFALLAVALDQWVVSFLLNTLWISVLYGSPYGTLLGIRAIQSAVLSPVHLAGLALIKKLQPRLERIARL